MTGMCKPMITAFKPNIKNLKSDWADEPRITIGLSTDIDNNPKVYIKAKNLPVDYPQEDVEVRRTNAVIFDGSLAEYKSFITKLDALYQDMESMKDIIKSGNWSI